MIRSLVRTGAALAVAATLSALGACAQMSPGTTTELDARFGDAVRQARARQTLNPEASRNTDPVAGMDGEAARNVMDEYHDSFKEPVRTFNVLGIGSVGGGSK